MTVQAWISSALRDLSTGRASFVSAHLDELGLDFTTWRAAVDSLEVTIAALPSTWGGRLSLALPLLETASLCTSAPEDLGTLADRREPPSLYLFDPSHFERHLTDGEAFREGVPAPVGLEDPRLRFEFASTRDADSAARGWDYVNTLWVHYVGSENGNP